MTKENWIVCELLFNFVLLADRFHCIILKTIRTSILNVNTANVKRLSGSEKLPELSKKPACEYSLSPCSSPLRALNELICFCREECGLISRTAAGERVQFCTCNTLFHTFLWRPLHDYDFETSQFDLRISLFKPKYSL